MIIIIMSIIDITITSTSIITVTNIIIIIISCFIMIIISYYYDYSYDYRWHLWKSLYTGVKQIGAIEIHMFCISAAFCNVQFKSCQNVCLQLPPFALPSLTYLP